MNEPRKSDNIADVERWQTQQIDKSLRQADAGDLIAHSGVKKAARSWISLKKTTQPTDISPA